MRWTKAATAATTAARTHDGQHTLADRLQALPAMIAATLTGRWHGASRLKVGFALLIPLYVLSPLDLVPDLLLPFGIADDAALIALATAILLSASDRWLTDRNANPVSAPGGAETIAGTVIARTDHDARETSANSETDPTGAQAPE